MQKMISFGILTVSTTCSKNPEQDKAGPALETEINKIFPDCRITYRHIVTDSQIDIIAVLNYVTQTSICDVMFTVGGTGFAPSDVTPEATKAVIEKEAPGLAYSLLLKSLAITDMAMLSRPVCGIKNKTIIINFPGSPKAAVECFGFIQSSLSHAVALLKDEKSEGKQKHQRIQQKFNESIVQEESKVKIQAGASRIRKSPYPMIEVENALQMVREMVSVISETEDIPIENALFRVLADDIRAPLPIPAFPASMKDGYAVRTSDGAGSRRVRSVAAAGDAPDHQALQPGECSRISTGAPLPAGADAVVQVEDTEIREVSPDGRDEIMVDMMVSPKYGENVRHIGSDIKADTIVLQKHSEISPAHIGVLAMLGIPNIKVIRRPSIGVISTGNELVHFKESLKPGLIHDSNKVTFLTLLKSYGYEANDCGIARDAPNSVKATLRNAFIDNDFIISSGGVSMSEYDLLKQVLLEDFDARIHFGRLNMKPGKPTVFATLKFDNKQKIIFALPGNPVSCYVTSLLFVIPTLKYMENHRTFERWPTVTVTLDHDVQNCDNRPEYVRLTIYRGIKNTLMARTTGNQISSRLNSMVDANGMLLIPGNKKILKGESASALLFGKLE